MQSARALRKDDRELWDEMIEEVRQSYAEAVEQSGKQLTAEPFFMALVLGQQKTIAWLKAELEELKAARVHCQKNEERTLPR